MRSLSIGLSIFVAACALAGCTPPAAGKKAPAKADPTAGAGSATVTPADVVLTAKGAPRRRDGYWEIRSLALDGAPMGKEYLCVDANSEERFSLFDQLTASGDCDKRDFVRTPTGWTFETSCKLMDTVTVQTGAISGDFQTRFLVDRAVFQRKIMRPRTIHGQYVGACPARSRPGAPVGGEGETLSNMLDY